MRRIQTMTGSPTSRGPVPQAFPVLPFPKT
jgi:hypothetical protein